jgi:hypothetical protein
MRSRTSITLDGAARRRLEAIAADRNAPQKHVWRARIILLSADGAGTNAIIAATGTAKTTVWRWQDRFLAEGVDGLLRDKTRPPGKAPVPEDQAARVVELTLKPPPHEATHWTGRAMAKTAGLAVSTVQRIWKAHGLAPHRWRRFKLSNDPAFAEKPCRRRALCRAARACRGAERRREIADPGARSNPAGPAAREESRRDHDARLQAPWHDRALRGPERTDRREVVPEIRAGG